MIAAVFLAQDIGEANPALGDLGSLLVSLTIAVLVGLGSAAVAKATEPDTTFPVD